jgi:hypothetical protein
VGSGNCLGRLQFILAAVESRHSRDVLDLDIAPMRVEVRMLVKTSHSF